MSADQLWDGELKGCVVDGVPVLVAKIDGKVCAYVDRCAHLGTRLSEGALDGTVVTCRAHQWQFDLATGAGVNPRSASLRRLDVAVRGGNVCIDATQMHGETADDARVVGPVLLRSSAARAIANAICAENPGTSIDSRGGYLRVNAPSPCVVTLEAIAAELGAVFTLPGDLELAMPSYRGLMTLTDASVRWD